MSSPVLVTGANSWVASHIVKRLLDSGFVVRGTVRALNDVDGLAHLKTLSNSHPGGLTLHQARFLFCSVALRDGSPIGLLRCQTCRRAALS